MKRFTAALAAVCISLLFPAAVYAEEPDQPPLLEPPVSLNEITEVTSGDDEDKPILKDIQIISQEGLRYIVKVYDVSPAFNSERLDEGPFENNGYAYNTCTILRASENYKEEKKLASQVMTVSSESKEGAVSKFVPFVDYSMDGYTGQLMLERDSIYTETAGSKRYSYTLSDTREFTGLERNDTYYIPKSVSKNGSTLKLADVSWQAMGDGLYRATAVYSGSGSGTKITGYLSTGTYIGEVSRSIPKSVTYKVIYEGTPIQPEPYQWTPWIMAGGVLLLLACLTLLLWHFRRNAKIYAMQRDGRYKVVCRYRISGVDPVVDLSSPVMQQYQDFLVTVDRFASRKLNSKSIRVLLGGGDFVMRGLEQGGGICSTRFHIQWPEIEEDAPGAKLEEADDAVESEQAAVKYEMVENGAECK